MLDELASQGVYTLRSPATAKALAQVCRAKAGNQPARHVVLEGNSIIGGKIPSRRFDSEMLVAIANITSKIELERVAGM